MNVIRVRDADGSHIEPPLDEKWSDLEKLQWHAAVVSFDGGIDVQVNDHGEVRHNGRRKVRELIYCIQYRSPGRGGSTAPLAYNDAWTYLSGIGLGAELARETTRNGA